MDPTRNVTVHLSHKKNYFGIEDGATYWLAVGTLLTCDCACSGPAKELKAEGIAETMTWRGKFLTCILFYILKCSSQQNI